MRRWSDGDHAALLVDAASDVEYRRGAAARHEAGRVDYIVAIRDNEIVGSGELTTDDPPELKNLWVESGERGSGIGTSIIAFAERLVERRAAETSATVRRLVVGVGVDNPRAAALYERLGYARTGTLSTTTYEFIDESGSPRTATETDEELAKEW